jgi:hypothetical protein
LERGIKEKTFVYSLKRKGYGYVHGHKNSIEKEFCSECGQKIKGMYEKDHLKVVAFENKIIHLLKYMNKIKRRYSIILKREM